MIEWLKQFVVIPLGYLATFATIIWLAVEMLSLTTWSAIKKISVAANKWRRMLKGESEPSRIPPLVIGLAIGAVAILAYTQFSKDKK